MNILTRAKALPMVLSILLLATAGVAGAGQLGLSVGPDVTIIRLDGVQNHTSSGGTACPAGYSGNCRGYSIGTDSCNIGSVPVDWCDNNSGCRVTTDDYHPVVATPTDHSVIGQNLYRLKDGRFQQIGLSFLKHGFVSTNSNNSDCVWNDDGDAQLLLRPAACRR